MKIQSYRAALILALLCGTLKLPAATPLTTISYSVPDSTYTQDFNAFVYANSVNAETSTVSATGPNNIQDLVAAPINAAMSVAGWSITNLSTPTRPRFLIEDGARSILPGGNYALYKIGTGLTPDFALGTCPYNGGNMVADTFPRMGAIFVNNTGKTLNSFVIRYRLEQWRGNGNHTVPFEYSVGATDINTLGTGSAFVAVPALTMATFSSSSFGIDGNAPGNFTTKTARVGFSWPPGAQLVIRWTDTNSNTSTPDKLGVDDFEFTASQRGTGFYLTDMSPPPGAVLTSVPASIVLTFRSNLSAPSVNTNSISVINSGADGVLGTADDEVVVPLAVSVVNGNQIKVDLPAQTRGQQQYRITAAASSGEPVGSTIYVQDLNGVNMDGEFSGAFPTGNDLGGGDFSATFSVSAAATHVAVSANPISVPYGIAGTVALTASVTATQSVNTGTVTFQLKRNGVNLGMAMTSGTVVNGSANVNYPVPAGTSAGSYTVVAFYSGGGSVLDSSDSSTSIDVTPALLTITSNNAARAYGAANPAFSGTVSGLKNGDVISATFSTTAGSTSPIGSYPITPTLSDPGGKLANYIVPATLGTLSIMPVALSVTPANVSRDYGAANPALTGTITGLQAGDAITATYSTMATAASLPGTYDIVPTLVDPANRSGNYTATLANGTFTIAPAHLYVLAANAARTYGAANPAFSGTIAGAVNGDAFTVFYFTSAVAGSAPGPYAITPVLFDPENKLVNYAPQYFDGTLTVSKAALTVVTSFSRPYGEANPNLTVSGIQNNDAITATYMTPADSASPVGTYSVVPTLKDPGGTLGNYTVSAPNGTMTVTPANLTVSTANASVVYGSAIPELRVTLTGVTNNDDISATASTTATAGSDAGEYPITGILADPGNKLSNYNLLRNTGTLTITRATLTITTAGASRLYGAPEPDFTGEFSGMLDGDGLSATYSAGTDAASPTGMYSIVPVFTDPLRKLANYEFNASYGTLTILKSTPAIAWPLPVGIVAGVVLSGTQLNATASDPISSAVLPGTFVYTPSAGTLLAPGLGQTLNVTFSPGDAQNYNQATATNTINVGPATPPQISSPLTVIVHENELFSYILTAGGSAPIVFTADGLPAGLSFSGNTISGSVADSGSYLLTLSATNYAGTDVKLLSINVIQSGANHAPVFSSPPTVSANPAQPQVPLTFTAQATDPDSDVLWYEWDFGDGTFSSGASVSKTFATPGIFGVVLTVTDGRDSISHGINMLIESQPPPPGFMIQKMNAAFNFTKAGKDNLSLSGVIPLPAGFSASGKNIRVRIGQIDYTSILTEKGATADKVFNLNFKLGALSGTYTAAFKNQALYSQLNALGFSQTTGTTVVAVPVIVTLDGASYFVQKSLTYSVKSNKKVLSVGEDNN